ncbi:MAG: L-serine ammonia-lyase, partial [Gammaproteobacteria bacterium]|nr:L-serine ammonia-lyase [Gammaproteobacteria bacterium]
MAVSIFDLFKIGIGPSSSHTVGPMKAACTFAQRLNENGQLQHTARVRVSLYGSLAHTGRGHGTDKAVILGLQGELPDTVDPDLIDAALERVSAHREIALLGRHAVPFNEAKDLVFRKRELLPYHPNGMRFEAMDASRNVLESRDYYSVGGGFVVSENKAAEDRIVPDRTRLPYSFSSGDELLALCEQEGKRISEIMLANEGTWRSETEVRAGLLQIRDAMMTCMARGFHQEGALPGGLRVARRAPRLFRELEQSAAGADSLSTLDWVNLYALAVNEENAAGGRVVTAPTNGAA